MNEGLVLKIVPVRYAHSGPNNIGFTQKSRDTPEAIKNIYDDRCNRGVEFLKENGNFVNLEFLYGVNELHGNQNEPRGFSELEYISKKIHDKICFLGGDNSISYYAAKAFRKKYPKRKCGLITLDAHPDLCKKGEPKMPYHSDWLRYLIDERVFNRNDIVGIGWRDIEQEERDFIRSSGLKQICLMSAIRRSFYNPNSSQLTEANFQLTIENFCKNFNAVYLSIDFDVIDPAFAPGVNTVSPCGMSSGYFIEIIKILSKIPQITAFDITEINPVRDINKTTQLLAIKTMIEMA